MTSKRISYKSILKDVKVKKQCKVILKRNSDITKDILDSSTRRLIVNRLNDGHFPKSSKKSNIIHHKLYPIKQKSPKCKVILTRLNLKSVNMKRNVNSINGKVKKARVDVGSIEKTNKTRTGITKTRGRPVSNINPIVGLNKNKSKSATKLINEEIIEASPVKRGRSKNVKETVNSRSNRSQSLVTVVTMKDLSEDLVSQGKKQTKKTKIGAQSAINNDKSVSAIKSTNNKDKNGNLKIVVNSPNKRGRPRSLKSKSQDRPSDVNFDVISPKKYKGRSKSGNIDKSLSTGNTVQDQGNISSLTPKENVKKNQGKARSLKSKSQDTPSGVNSPKEYKRRSRSGNIDKSSYAGNTEQDQGNDEKNSLLFPKENVKKNLGRSRSLKSKFQDRPSGINFDVILPKKYKGRSKSGNIDKSPSAANAVQDQGNNDEKISLLTPKENVKKHSGRPRSLKSKSKDRPSGANFVISPKKYIGRSRSGNNVQDQENNDEQNSLLIPKEKMKKHSSRGRARNVNNEAILPSSINLSTSNEKNSLKRGRGTYKSDNLDDRSLSPKKIDRPRSVSNEDLSLSTANKNFIQKRGRGRPRSLSNKDSSANKIRGRARSVHFNELLSPVKFVQTNTHHHHKVLLKHDEKLSSSTPKGSDGNNKSLSVKIRSRGRPRTINNEDSSSSKSRARSRSVHFDISLSPVKSGKRNVACENICLSKPEENLSTKRGRGRPTKINVEDSPIKSISPVKSKGDKSVSPKNSARGRARSANNDNSLPRKSRGRPRSVNIDESLSSVIIVNEKLSLYTPQDNLSTKSRKGRPRRVNNEDGLPIKCVSLVKSKDGRSLSSKKVGIPRSANNEDSTRGRPRKANSPVKLVQNNNELGTIKVDNELTSTTPKISASLKRSMAMVSNKIRSGSVGILEDSQSKFSDNNKPKAPRGRPRSVNIGDNKSTQSSNLRSKETIHEKLTRDENTRGRKSTSLDLINNEESQLGDLIVKRNELPLKQSKTDKTVKSSTVKRGRKKKVIKETETNMMNINKESTVRQSSRKKSEFGNKDFIYYNVKRTKKNDALKKDIVSAPINHKDIQIKTYEFNRTKKIDIPTENKCEPTMNKEIQTKKKQTEKNDQSKKAVVETDLIGISKPNVEQIEKAKVKTIEPNTNKKRPEIKPILKKSSPLKNRRGKVIPNYAELSGVQSPKTSINRSIDKRPIYKKRLPEIIDNKPDDVFEFDFKEEKMPKRRLRRNSALNEYDKGMDSILENIVKKVKKVKKRAIKKVVKVNEQAKTDVGMNILSKKLDGKLKKIACDIVNKVESKDQIQKETIDDKEILDENNEIDHNLDDVLLNMDDDDLLNMDVDLLHIDDDLPHIDDDLPHIDDDLPNFNDNPKDDIENSFGFHESSIRIISNVQIKPPTLINPTTNKSGSISNLEETFFKQPIANSTVLEAESMPFRFDGVVRRASSFLILKRSNGLPSCSQNMIIDHNFLSKLTITNKSPDSTKSDEAIEETNNTMPKEITINGITESTDVIINDACEENFDTPTKFTKQTSILNFVNASYTFKPPLQDENAINCSLFDDGNLSPIKAAVLSPMRRKVLSELNTVVGSTPLSLMPTTKENSLFGFNNSNYIVEEQKNKPTRFNINEIKRVIYKEKKDEPKVVVEYMPVLEEVNESNDDDAVTENKDVALVGLFEEFEHNKTPARSYPNRRAKRHRHCMYDMPDADEVQLEKPKKKKKDARTKKEEVEAEKWAEAFNSMCKEVEEHNLEIE